MYISVRGKNTIRFYCLVVVQANVVQCPCMKSKKFILQEECEEIKETAGYPP